MYLCGSYYHFKLAISGNISGKGTIIMSMEVDILGVDVMGVDVLGVDVMALISLNIFYFQNCTLQHIHNTITQRNRIGTKAYSLYSSSPEHV